MRRRSLLCLLAVFAFVCTVPVPAEETTEFRFYDEHGTLLTNVNVAFHTGAVSSKMAPQSSGVYTVPVGPGSKVSFQDKNDGMYRYILANLYKMQAQLMNDVKRFDMPDFRPRDEYIRKMQRFGFLPKDLGPDDPVDVYETDRRYWESFWVK